ncbi:MAG: DNA translocase FtsK 4TM domain-containing protein [Candidatus Binatota bacterium]|nr:DNA translocase FtsK 4TM domain-containing protein [Candidatus Binatota bacterium]
MAKKKKSVKKKARKAAVAEPSPFWRQAGAVLFMLGALFLLLGGFGIGGALPVKLFEGAYWTFGWVAYLTPLALVYWGVSKFMAEDHELPLSKLTGMLAVLVFGSGWAYTAFASENGGVWIGGHGGEVGELVGNMALSALDKIPAALLFLVLTVLAVFFAFGISLKVLLKLADLFKRP